VNELDPYQFQIEFQFAVQLSMYQWHLPIITFPFTEGLREVIGLSIFKPSQFLGVEGSAGIQTAMSNAPHDILDVQDQIKKLKIKRSSLLAENSEIKAEIGER
jgi:hypothetical protein